jgi:hypothetical protein
MSTCTRSASGIRSCARPSPRARVSLGTDFLAAAVDGLRAELKLGHLLLPLALYAYMAARLGHWDAAITAAEEARRLVAPSGLA